MNLVASFIQLLLLKNTLKKETVIFLNEISRSEY